VNRENVGFIVSTGLLIAGYFWVNNYYAQKNPAPAATSQTAAATATATPSANTIAQIATPQAIAPSAVEIIPVKPEDLHFALNKLDVTFTENGGCMASAKVNGFKASLKSDDRADIFPNYQRCKAYGLRIGHADLRDKPARIVRTGSRIDIVQAAEGLEVTRSFEFTPDSYKGKFSLAVKNTSAARQTTPVLFEMGGRSENESHTGMFASTPQQGESFAYRAEDSVTRVLFPFEKEPTQKVLASPTKVAPDWLEVGSMHFMNALLPLQKDPLNIMVSRTGNLIQPSAKAPFDQTVYEAWIELPLELNPGDSKTFSFDLYLGPKTKTELDTFGDRKLIESVNYGFFSIVAWPLFFALSFIYKVVGNWGVAIIILTAFVKMLLYPLALKSYIASKKMTKMQPQMKALQEKYKDDKQKLNQEMMAFMSQSGANPLSGCLPILPQFPIFFGLFSVFQQTFELRHAPFYGWVKDLSVMDPYFVLPVIMMITYVIQQRITPMPAGMDPLQKRMMQFLPFVFSLMMITFPSGLVLYFVTNTLLTIAQQVYMMRKYKEV
jgi:YidC/Oxa1 family membrane protein insertase